MKLKIVTILQQERRHEKGYRQLIQSLEHFDYDYHAINPRPYRWYGDKLINTAAYVETIRDEYTHFLFLDGTDTFALAPESEIPVTFDDCILMSCEKALWPHTAEKYRGNYDPQFTWCFLNSGSYLAPIDLFLKMWNENKVDFRYDDQLWFHDRYNATPELFVLDRACFTFQSIAFQAEGEFEVIENKIFNQINQTLPIFIHGNGRTPMDWVYNLLP